MAILNRLISAVLRRLLRQRSTGIARNEKLVAEMAVYCFDDDDGHPRPLRAGRALVAVDF